MAASLGAPGPWLRCCSVTTYPFLSDDWFDAVQRIMAQRTLEIPAHADLLMNLIVTETPFGADRLLHVGARDGSAAWGVGHADGADLTLTTDYTTARHLRERQPGRRDAGVHGGSGEGAGRPHQAHGGAGHRCRSRCARSGRGALGHHRIDLTGPRSPNGRPAPRAAGPRATPTGRAGTRDGRSCWPAGRRRAGRCHRAGVAASSPPRMPLRERPLAPVRLT